MSRPIDQLMQKEMTRQEFIATLGFAIASIMGLSTIIHMLTGKSFTHHSTQSGGLGYGVRNYGGQ